MAKLFRHGRGNHTPPTDLQNVEVPMRRVMLTLFAPIFAVGMLLVTALFPTPGDLIASISPVGTKLQPVDTGVSVDGSASEYSFARRLANTAGPQAARNADCFEDLKLADQAKLDRCAVVVYRALAEVEQNGGPFRANERMIASLPDEQVIKQLRLAATEVCRAKWARSTALPSDSPACELAQVSLDR